MPHSHKSRQKNKKVPPRFGEAGRLNLARPSFTLIELMVSTGILAVIIIAAVGIYVYAIGSQQKSTANANLQEDGQNILAMISKDIRATRIDYSYYPGGIIPTPTSTLALIDDYDSSSANYMRIAYRYKSVSQTIERCKQIGASCDSDNKFEVMNMSAVFIQRLDFYISPTSTPFYSGATVIVSPRITIILGLGSQNKRFGQKTIRLEQTINPRYEEKE